MSASTHDHAAHAAHEHRPTWQYIAIAVFLSAVTAFELGPLFGYYRLPPLVLIGLSAVKFFTVVAFYMHLWDDNPMFARLFAAPLIGATLMVAVLMTLHHTFFPSPTKDPFAVQERWHDNWNGECSSWLRSHATNRWYCSSPPIDMQRVIAEVKKTGPVDRDISALSDDAKLAALKADGKDIYAADCASCHQADGKGVPGSYPPLAGSDYLGDPAHHAGIVVKGLANVPITVNGASFQGTMPARGTTYSDYGIAAVVTFERNSWGNPGGMVLPADVKALR